MKFRWQKRSPDKEEWSNIPHHSVPLAARTHCFKAIDKDPELRSGEYACLKCSYRWKRVA
jgi:hypothetical protein